MITIAVPQPVIFSQRLVRLDIFMWQTHLCGEVIPQTAYSQIAVEGGI